MCDYLTNWNRNFSLAKRSFRLLAKLKKNYNQGVTINVWRTNSILEYGTFDEFMRESYYNSESPGNRSIRWHLARSPFTNTTR